MDAVGMIVKVVQAIVKAAETARQNRKRCLDLADRARTVGDILREDRHHDSASTSRTRLMRKPSLERLKAALDDALELVESQRRFGLGIPGRTAAKFQDVETRITACVVDLGLAEQIAARRRDRDHRADAEAATVQEPAPPPQQQGKAEESLFYNQYLDFEQKQQSLLQGYLPQLAALPAQQGNGVLQGYLAQSAQQGKDAEAFVQSYLAQSAQQGKEAEAFVHGYLAQSAQQAKDAQPLLQAYLAQSAQQGADAQSLLLQGYLAQSAAPPLPQQGHAVQSVLQGYLAQSTPLPPHGQDDVMSLLQGYLGM